MSFCQLHFNDFFLSISVFVFLGNNDDLLVLIDQHAAHERVRLEQLQSGNVKQTKGQCMTQIYDLVLLL